MLIHLAHSPDADDAFMFYAIAKEKIPTHGFEFTHVLKDIESLNHLAITGKYEVTAISVGAYPYCIKDYDLLPVGASVGEGYGPVLVADHEIPFSEISNISIAVPGKYTTAALVLKLAIGEFPVKILPFDQIIPAVLKGEFEAGLVIHEGQITHSEQGLLKILDLGEWWKKETGLPLPLGIDVIRKDLGQKTIQSLTKIFEESIRYGMAHEEEALQYALSFGRGVDFEKARTFVRMYVNEKTLNFSEKEKQAVKLLLQMGSQKGFIPDLNLTALS
ncbi:MAG: ABC transporter substrate-binding protein [Candidatus Eremiobacteraeota bacterium]|jgi:1,4-dihydroxy-6-naphthoate synthase|nr:ABC transporter substrate-binding protein [Candidatus Eremiobacteraeota bacterium]MCL5054428.1 ABC transporter substrate-binding protein [Bacillota bacterium]